MSRHLRPQDILSDLIAGIPVGLVALLLAMAFAVASNLPPQAELYCAIVTGFLISSLGGPKTQIGGPTGAFVVVIFGIIAQQGVSSLFMCTAVKFFSHPVILGFTNGIAIFIASTQVLAMEDRADRLHASVRHLIFCGARKQPARLMHQVEFERHIGRENICPHVQAALERAGQIYDRRHRRTEDE